MKASGINHYEDGLGAYFLSYVLVRKIREQPIYCKVINTLKVESLIKVLVVKQV